MYINRNSKAMRRVQLTVVSVVIVITLYYFLPARHPVAGLPPLPGTYQYFRETDFHSATRRFGGVSHCDSRFAPKETPEVDEVRRSLVALLRTYAAAMDDLGIETWLAHGALLGWYWNKKLLPWDTDLDVHVSAENLTFLAMHHNMSEHRYAASEGGSLRTYLLDINPHYSLVSKQDVANKIDGRWIDTTNGKFVDITAVHCDNADHVEGRCNTMFCKDGHEYEDGDIYPLQPSTLEGIKVSIPSRADKVLQEEYGKPALTNDRFHWHRFNHQSKLWEPE